MPQPGLRKVESQPALNGSSMKIRRNNKSFSNRSLRDYSPPAYDRGPRDGHSSISSRLRVLSFYFTVFVSGCLLTGFLLSMSPQQSLERSSSRLMLQHPAGTVHRRGLYTASTGGLARSWDVTRRPLHPSQLLLLQNQMASKQLSAVRSSTGAAASSTVASSGSSTASSRGAAAGSQTSGGSSSSRKQQLGPKGELPAADNVEEPEDFNWKAYLLRYPDLRSSNIRTKEAAAWHYTQKGHKEHRSYEKVNILLRYTACQGLFNQMYAHLNALVLAEYLGADVMLPPSVYRESFSKYFSMDLKKNEVKWTPTSIGALLDVDAVAAHYAQKGMKVLPTAEYESFPDCMRPQEAFPRYKMPSIQPEQVVRLGDTYLQSMHIWYIWDRAAEKVLEKHKALVAAGRPANTTVVLDLPCPFLSIMTLTCMEAAREAATALKFNRTLVGMARTIINGMKQAGVTHYNGAHLRLEKDAVEWARILGGMKKYLAEYARSFAAAGLNRHKDLYIASGLLSYNASKEMTDMLKFLQPHSRTVQYKELYLPPEMLRALNPEQEALVDFLVLANSDNFVGLGSSTFSVYLREYRVLLGHARLADVFVDTSRIGTDALFERCTHFAPLDTS